MILNPLVPFSVFFVSTDQDKFLTWVNLLDSLSSLFLDHTGGFWWSFQLPPCFWSLVRRRYNQLGTRMWPCRLPGSVHTRDIHQGVDLYIPAFLKRNPGREKCSMLIRKTKQGPTLFHRRWWNLTSYCLQCVALYKRTISSCKCNAVIHRCQLKSVMQTGWFPLFPNGLESPEYWPG